MIEQFNFFRQDIKRMLGRRKERILYIWLSRSFAGILLYRTERSLLLMFGKFYEIIRILFLPLIHLIQAYSNMDIHYKADIKGGLLVLHPSLGIVISGKSMIGYNLTLVGGNAIGINKVCTSGDFVIGDHCSLGANAVIMGPVILANHINIGASACVTKDCLISGTTLIGVPAKAI